MTSARDRGSDEPGDHGVRTAARSRATAPAESAGAQSVLLASEGRPFDEEAVRLAARLARARRGHVRVLSIARMWGTSFGLPHPGLLPNKREMAEHESNVAKAVRALKRAGVSADGHIISTRKATKSILGEAERQGCGAIVMGADARRAWLVGDFMWSQEPYRVRRRAEIPVHLVGPDG